VTPVHLTANRFGTVDKVYIHTAQNQVVSPLLQTATVLTLDTGYTPFFTDPHRLAQDIEMAAMPIDLNFAPTGASAWGQSTANSDNCPRLEGSPDCHR
jgi:hypothetical protein